MSLMYKVCYRTINRGGYPEDMTMRVNVFYGGGLNVLLLRRKTER